METIEAAGRDVREAARRTEHAKGVFIYARYAVEKLNPQDTVSLDELRDFPDGITGFYDVQFNRLLGANYECIGNHSPMWRVVEAVMAAREPLHVEALDDLVECSAFERKSAVATLSMLFPVRDHRLHVFHKSVKDWLVNPERKEEMCYVGVQRVHETLGKRCHEILQEALGNNEASEASVYALKHCVAHLCEGGRRQEARGLMFRLEYLEERAKLGPAHALVLDGNRIRSGKKAKALELLHSAIKLSQPALQRDPAQLGVQVGGHRWGPNRERIRRQDHQDMDYGGRVPPDVGRPQWWCNFCRHRWGPNRERIKGQDHQDMDYGGRVPPDAQRPQWLGKVCRHRWGPNRERIDRSYLASMEISAGSDRHKCKKIVYIYKIKYL